MERWKLHTMNWSRKGALLMLAVVVFWTAMPAGACLLGMRLARQPDCCRGMARECGSPGMSASSSCCRAHRQNIAVTPVPPYTPEHSQKLASVLYQAGQHLLASSPAGYWNALKAPPPKLAPGGSCILRI
jgi:hypothetical protein